MLGYAVPCNISGRECVIILVDEIDGQHRERHQRTDTAGEYLVNIADVRSRARDPAQLSNRSALISHLSDIVGSVHERFGGRFQVTLVTLAIPASAPHNGD